MKNSKWNSPFEGFKTSTWFGIALLFSFASVIFSCNGQVKKERENGDDLVTSDTINKPQINVKVNKRYDKNGNVVMYDSTYSYVYKGSPGRRAPLSNDSIFNSFRSYFKIHSPEMFDRQNNSVFFTDSLFKYDFFNDDYFQKRFELNQKLFSDFYKQMDSLKGNYLRETYPDKKPEKSR